MNAADFVQIVEVSPRDGLQNETQIVSRQTKINLIDRLSECGLNHIEVGAFVSPKWVPQMAESAEVFAAIAKKPGVIYSCLVPNEKGMQTAIACGVKTIAVFVAASESFSKKNINCSIAESLERLAPVFDMARAGNIQVRGYVSCVMGCPFEGEIAPAQVTPVAKSLYDMGAYEISLGDTIGVGTADKTRALIDAIAPSIPVGKLALHCHDTFGGAIECIDVGLDMGIRTIDSAVAGIGGCPYAKSTAGQMPPGNVATEKVLNHLLSRGFETGIDREKITQTAEFIGTVLTR